MSNVNVNAQFAEFGKKMNTLGILAILGFIIGLIANFVAVVGIISIIIQILILIFLFSALGNAKEVAYALNNRLLHEFRSKIIYAFIFYLIGLFFFTGALIGLQAVITYAPGSGAGILALLGVIIFGVIILLIAAIFRIQGWSRLQSFFTENKNMFSPQIGESALNGAKYNKIAAILYLTIILMFIGFILEVIGYFKLAALKNLTGAPISQSAAKSTPASSTVAATSAKKFCPNCGSPVTGNEKFCSSCGSEIK